MLQEAKLRSETYESEADGRGEEGPDEPWRASREKGPEEVRSSSVVGWLQVAAKLVSARSSGKAPPAHHRARPRVAFPLTTGIRFPRTPCKANNSPYPWSEVPVVCMHVRGVAALARVHVISLAHPIHLASTTWMHAAPCRG